MGKMFSLVPDSFQGVDLLLLAIFRIGQGLLLGAIGVLYVLPRLNWGWQDALTPLLDLDPVRV